MRFHVVGLPHTNITDEFSSCAFTQKVRRFCKMMKSLGHHVTLYGGPVADVECDEFLPCISEKRRAEMVGDKHYVEADWGHPHWAGFNANVIGQMHERIEPKDFICLIGGQSHKPIADAFPGHMSVEFGIGYSGTFATYRVFESYAWMHMVYGAEAGNASKKDGGWWDAVIPNQVDLDIFSATNRKYGGEYFLYAGRLIHRKGYRIAQDVCERLGKRLILAGMGPQDGYGEFVGDVDAKTLAGLMADAAALFVPTEYVEPFGTVHIEAMACGTPVITTDWGVFTETVVNGVNGFRCRNLSEFCEAATKIDELDRVAIRDAARARYSMSTIAREYEAYFERLMKMWGRGWYEGAP
jgi:glycosyltransferase involved in cell wall biosynthesis